MSKKKKALRLAHVSDTHIRNLKFHEDYRAVFEHLYEILREEKPDYIVHCGDVAHTKTQLSPEFFEMAANFFDKLSDIAPLVLIAGNHDGNLKNSSRQDALTPIINALDKDTIHYLKNSGEFSPTKGLTFNVLSVFDRDNWVSPSDDKSINIALYHGAIAGVTTDIGWVMDHGEDTVDIFEGHDYAFLGDIHKTNQILDTEGRVRYCGSTVQQNHGETNDKGFLIWDIKDKDTFEVKHHILKNPRPFMTIELTKTGRFPKTANPPVGARLRIVTNHSIPVEKVRKAIDIARTKFNPESVTFLNRATGSRAKVDIGSDFEKHNLRDVAVQEKLIGEYLKDYLSDTSEDKEVLKEVMEINRRINAQAVSVEAVAHRNVNWHLKTLEWSNLFNYGEGNKVDFDNLGGIIGIFGKNFSGKSSIIDSLLWVMYNSTSKRNRKSVDIVNQNKQNAWGKVTIEVNDKLYTIERTADKYIKRLKGEETEEVKTNVEFSVYDLATEESSPLNGETRSQTDDNVKIFFGTLDDFLMTSLSSQLESLAFIAKGSTKRKGILAKFLDLEIFEAKHSIAKIESSDLDGKIKYLLDSAGPLGHEVRKLEVQKEIEEATMDLRNQEVTCKGLTKELEELNLDIMRIETRMESTPVQKVIDPEQEKVKIRKFANDLESVRENNLTLESAVVSNEAVIVKIDDFLKEFDYESWKKKETQIEQLNFQISQNFTEVAELERGLKEVSENKLLLQQVPCGNSFPNCKFIKHAHDSLAKEDVLHGERKDVERSQQKAYDEAAALDEASVAKYLEQHGQLVQKRRDKQDEINKFELQIAKNKTIIVSLRGSKSAAEEEVRVFEENEKTILEFAKLTIDRTELVRVKTKKKKELALCNEASIQLSRKHGLFERELKDVQAQEMDLERFQRDFSAYDLYKKAMGSNGVSLDIIKKELPVINDEMAKILANVVNFEVFLENEETQLNVLIKHPSFEPRPLEMGSGAEKAIAAMAIRLAFMNVSSLPIGDVFILDEPGTALDEENMEGFIRILDLVKSYFKNVILISHLDSLKDSVDLQIVIEKKDKFAFVNQ
jgi:DNA repair exonuclease SbcCD ATPase subunit/DNA repair exonuclease SbcCD nuclease subunit